MFIVRLVRPLGALRRGDVRPGASAAGSRPASRRAGETDGLTRRSTLRELTAAIPGLREELVDRARVAGLLVGWACLCVVPAWTVVDRVLAPSEANAFLVLRLVCEVPMLLAVWALWRLPGGRRRPERLTYLVLFVVQAEVAWMALRVHEVSYYLLGFTVAIYVSGCVLVARPRWTVRLVAVSWAALIVSGLTAPEPPKASTVVALAVYVGTASLVAMLAHVRRFALNTQELLTRARLEHEQERTRALLGQLERLSHEDALTGLANRRRWDAELVTACAHARQHGTSVGLVLLDLDRFKAVNDRHGHAGGDEALRQVAAMLTRSVRGEDLVARLGGDELAVLMPGADLDRVAGLAERLRAAAVELQPAGFTPGELTLSLGVTAVAGAQAFPLELMSCADAQLYRAKITRNAVALPGIELPRPRIPLAAEAVEPAR